MAGGGVSFSVSGLALGLVLLPALLLGFALAYLPIPARWLWLSCINTLQSVPTVVIGLLLYMLLSRAGPFGDWKMLFTQQAMVVGQMLIAFPVIATMAHAAFVQSDRRAWETARTLGLSWPRALLGLMRECRFGLLAAVIGAFSRIVTEVGCSMMVGATFCTSPATSPPPSRWRPRKGPSPRGGARYRLAEPGPAAQPVADRVPWSQLSEKLTMAQRTVIHNQMLLTPPLSRSRLCEEPTMPPPSIHRSTPWP